MRFYNMGLTECLKLRADDEEMLWKAITVIEARDMLMAFTVADYPHMKTASRRSTYNKIHRMAFPHLYGKAAKRVSMEEFFKRARNGLKGRG